MLTFLKLLVGGFVALILFIVIGSAFVPTRTPEQRQADIQASCRAEVGLQHALVTQGQSPATDAATPRQVTDYARCLLRHGY